MRLQNEYCNVSTTLICTETWNIHSAFLIKNKFEMEKTKQRMTTVGNCKIVVFTRKGEYGDSNLPFISDMLIFVRFCLNCVMFGMKTLKYGN